MKIHPAVKDLLAEIDAFCKENDIGPSQFGLAAVNDGNFIRALKMGRTPSLSTIDRVNKYMQSYARQKTA